MPELPEVETVRRGLEPAMVGATITEVELRRADLRFAFPERFRERLTGQMITALSRRAKYLLADLSGGEALIMHLGMTGRFLVEQAGASVQPGEFHHEHGSLPAHDHVVFHLEGQQGRSRITYNDVRRFGFMDLVSQSGIAGSKHFARMGIEPLGNELSGELLQKLFAGRFAPLKAMLLDQKIIAGLGNIYVCEALFRAGLRPDRPAASVSAGEAERLAGTIRDVLTEAVAAGGSTLRDFAHADGSLGYFQHTFRVYDREGEPCVTPGCKGTVTRFVQSGRSTFHCPTCQV